MLFNLFGKKKKKRTLQRGSIVFYQLIEPPYEQLQETVFSPQTKIYNESPILEHNKINRSYQSPRLIYSSKDRSFEQQRLDEINFNPKNKNESRRISFVSQQEQNLRTSSASAHRRITKVTEPKEEFVPETHPRKLSGYREQTIRRNIEKSSVLDPPIQTGQTSAPKRTSEITEPAEECMSQVHPRKLTRFQEHSEPNTILLLNRKEGKPTPATKQGSNQTVRLSVVQPIEVIEHSQPPRLSRVRMSEAEEFPLMPTHQPVIYAVRRSISKPTDRKSFSIKKLFTKKRKFEEQDSDEEEEEDDETVYAYRATPTRGRTGSILQQSVKSLTSQKEETDVPWKSMRRSMDTDVFSADVKRRSVVQRTPGYVNMERGQGMLVSELLNPITSIFVSDLKDPVPKDPLSKPRELNNWVRPRQSSMRQVVTPKEKPHVKIAVEPVKLVHKTSAPQKKRQYLGYESDRDQSSDSDSSEESREFYERRQKYSRQKKPVHHHRVYTASMPPTVLPEQHEMRSNQETDVINPANPSVSEHLLSGEEEEERVVKLSQPPYVGRLSMAEQADILNTLDFLCRPPENNREET